MKTLRYTDQGEEGDDGEFHYEASERHQRIVAQLIPQLSGLLPQDAELQLDLAAMG